jgi:nitrate reductase delta subunit
MLRGRRQQSNAMLYKLCSLFLLYPDAELLGARAEVSAAAASLPSSSAADSLREFCTWWEHEDPLALQQRYVETFDLDRRCSLYLTFYAQGDTRDRGPALLRLKRLYRAAGLPIADGELPDFLPAMLEFAAAAPAGQGEVVLREHRAGLELLRQSLREREHEYRHVLDAVCVTAGDLTAADRARAIKIAAGGPPTEQVGLEPFGPPEIVPTTGARR